MFYNLDFIKKAFGTNIPNYINWDLLFNVAYCIDDENIKLYFIADEKYYLYKCSKNGEITKQFDASKTFVDIDALNNFSNYKFDYNDLVIDTIEKDIFYIYCEESSYEQIVRLLERLLFVYGIDRSNFFKIVSNINNSSINSFSEIYDKQAVSMVKISLKDKNFKIYARPYKVGNDFTIPMKTQKFLQNVFNCQEEDLDQYITNLWVSYNFGNGKITISTQNDELKEFL